MGLKGLLFDKIKKVKTANKKEINLIKSEIADDFKKVSEIYNQTKKTVKDEQFSMNSYPYQREKKVFE